MNRIITWLKDHPLWNVLICIGYYLLVVLPHEWVGVTIAGLFAGKSRLYYNNVILALALGLALVVFIPLVSRLLNHPRGKLGWIYLMNGYTVTLLLTSLVGAFDEAYQYFYLSPQRTDYYDLNDVVFNTLGGACGLLWLWSYGYQSAYRTISKILRSWQLWLVIGTVLILTLLILVGKCAYFPMEGIDSLWTLVRKVPEGFWTSIDNNTITFHVTMPIEGLIYCTCLWVFYGTMDFTSSNRGV